MESPVLSIRKVPNPERARLSSRLDELSEDLDATAASVLEVRRVLEDRRQELMRLAACEPEVRNLQDLAESRRLLARRLIDAFEEMTELRRDYYEPRLPVVDQEFREFDSRIRLRREQYELLQRRLQELLIIPRPEYLATAEERQIAEQLSSMEASLTAAASPQADVLLERVARLRGALTWTLETEYHDRLNEFDAHLRELQSAIDAFRISNNLGKASDIEGWQNVTAYLGRLLKNTLRQDC